jgi:hypothetical protein
VQRIFTQAVASNAEAEDLAEAILQQYQLGHDTGSGQVPMNVGQELYDYVNITDSRAGDARSGNIQYIRRYANTLKNTMGMEIAFGSDNYVRNMLAGSLTRYLTESRWTRLSDWDRHGSGL